MPVSSRKYVPAMQINSRTQKFQPSLDMQKISEEDEQDRENGIPRYVAAKSKATALQITKQLENQKIVLILNIITS
jgi:hypothetical protein